MPFLSQNTEAEKEDTGEEILPARPWSADGRVHLKDGDPLWAEFQWNLAETGFNFYSHYRSERIMYHP